MILLIDTSERVSRVAVATPEQFLAVRECGAGSDLGKKIIEEVDALLKDQSLTWQDINHIAVHRGKAGSSFMALRVGIVTATMLAESLNCELVAVSGNTLEIMVQEADKNEPVQVIEPKYTSPGLQPASPS